MGASDAKMLKLHEKQSKPGSHTVANTNSKSAGIQHVSSECMTQIMEIENPQV